MISDALDKPKEELIEMVCQDSDNVLQYKKEVIYKNTRYYYDTKTNI